MKRIIALLVTVVLLAACASALADGRKFVTINEWLDAKGECGDCALVVQVREVLGPVLAVVEDETGSVNLFTGTDEDLLKTCSSTSPTTTTPNTTGTGSS